MVDIETCPLSSMDYATRLKERPLLGKLCSAIAKQRSQYGRTVWHDSGDIENFSMFQTYLPENFEWRV